MAIFRLLFLSFYQTIFVVAMGIHICAVQMGSYLLAALLIGCSCLVSTLTLEYVSGDAFHRPRSNWVGPLPARRGEPEKCQKLPSSATSGDIN